MPGSARYRFLRHGVHVEKATNRGQVHAHPGTANFCGQGIQCFEQEALAIGDGAAVSVLTIIQCAVKELFEQIAIGAVQFDAIKTRVYRSARGADKVVGDAMHLGHAQCSGGAYLYGAGLAFFNLRVGV